MERKQHSRGDWLRKDNVWRNYAQAKSNNSTPRRGYDSGPESGAESGSGSGAVSGAGSGAGAGAGWGYYQYDNRSLFPPLEEPRQASKKKLNSHQAFNCRNSDAGNSSSNSSQSDEPRTEEQHHPRRLVNPSFALLQQQSGRAQSLLPRWMRTTDVMCLSSVSGSSSSTTSSSNNTPAVPRQEACPEEETATGAATAESDFARVAPLEKEKVKPMTTLTARVICRDGPFGSSSTIELVPSGSNEGAPLGACCVNLVFESFGMIGISPNSTDPQVYDIKRSPNLLLTPQQKQRLYDAIETNADGQVLDALDKVIQEIREEIDQMSPDLGPSDPNPGGNETSAGIVDIEEAMASATPEAVHEGGWTWVTTTPTSKSANPSPISQCLSQKIRHHNSKTNSRRNLVTRTHTMRGISYSPSNATADDSHFQEAPFNARARSPTGYPVDMYRSSFDFSQPPFPRKG